MSALSTVTSNLTESTTEKKAEEGYGRIVPASGGLHVIAEDGDADEAAQVAGDVAQTFTADEEDAVRRKLDRRILPLLAIIYFSQYLDKNSKRPRSRAYIPRFPTHWTVLQASTTPPLSAASRSPARTTRSSWQCSTSVSLSPRSRSLSSPSAFPSRGSESVSSCTSVNPRSSLTQLASLGVNILIWATCLTLHAASGAFAPFLVFRLLLGAFESVVAPIMIALVASFYRKEEQAKRIASFYVCNGITAILGGLIAWGISHVESRQPGREPWRIVSAPHARLFSFSEG